MGLPPVFEKYRNEIDTELKSVLEGYELPLYDMLRYHLGFVDEKGNPRPNSAGKTLRPVLCLLTCEAVGGDYKKALPAAAALELVHNYSLIHDDIQDDDRERRHIPTVWSIWGKPQGINAGTAMRILANSAVDRLGELGISEQKQMRVYRLLDKTTLAIIEGQYLDISYENRLDIGIDEYLDMIAHKTGALFACSMELGAMLGTNTRPVINSFSQIGMNIGMGFQIKDDILGIWGDEQKIGKAKANDIRRKKKSLPIVYTLSETTGEMKREMLDIYSNGSMSEASVAKVMDILDTVKAQQQAQKLVEEYSTKALEELEKLDIRPSRKKEISGLFHFLLTRDK